MKARFKLLSCLQIKVQANETENATIQDLYPTSLCYQFVADSAAGSYRTFYWTPNLAVNDMSGLR